MPTPNFTKDADPGGVWKDFNDPMTWEPHNAVGAGTLAIDGTTLVMILAVAFLLFTDNKRRA